MLCFPVPTPINGAKTSIPNIIPKPTIESIPQTKLTLFNSIVFPTQTLTLPSKGNVYQVSTRSITIDFAKQIASRFSFADQPQSFQDQNNNYSLLWNSRDGSKYLYIYTNNGIIEYGNNAITGKSDIGEKQTTETISPNSIVSKAVSFLKEKGLFPNDFTFSSTNIQYYVNSGGSEPTQVTDIAKANVYKISFSRAFDSYPVYLQQGSANSATVWIDQFGLVKKLTFAYSEINPGPKHFSLLSYNQIKSQLLKGEGIITSFGGDVFGEQPIPVNTRLIIDSISFAYFDDGTSSFIQPIYVIKGDATAKDGKTYPIIIYLSALL